MTPRLAALLALLLACARPAAAEPLTDAQRAQFVGAGAPDCESGIKKNLGGDATLLRGAGIDDDTISAYCRCQMESLAGQLSQDEFAGLLKGEPPATMQGHAETAHGACAPLLTGAKPS